MTNESSKSVLNLLEELTSPSGLELSAELFILRDLKRKFSKRDNIRLLFEENPFLNDFIWYIFHRRFGWSDQVDNARQPVTRARSDSFASDSKNKKQINDVADEFLSFLALQPLNPELLNSLSFCASKAATKAVVRQQTLQFFFSWLIQQMREEEEGNGPALSIVNNFAAVKVSLTLQLRLMPYRISSL